MKRDRYHAELTRLPPDHLADIITKQREQIAMLERLVKATNLHREIIPQAYVLAVTDLYWIAHGKTTSSRETPSRPVPQSRPPGGNTEALRVYREEKAVLNGRAGWLTTAVEHAVRWPEGKPPKAKRSAA